MAVIHKKIFVQAPLKEVYDWIEWSPNFVEVWPNLIKSTKYSQDENGLGHHETVYMMAGVQFQVISQDSLKEPYKKIISESTTGITNRLTWVFEETKGGVELTLTAEYEAPGKAIRQLTLGLIKRLNEADLNKLMENLKIKLETLYPIS